MKETLAARVNRAMLNSLACDVEECSKAIGEGQSAIPSYLPVDTILDSVARILRSLAKE